MKLTLGDMEQNVSLAQVVKALDQMKQEMITYVMAGVEHWTDDEGLHTSRWEDDLEAELMLKIEQELLEKLLR